MTAKQTYPIRSYVVGRTLLTLRNRAKLTQAELAARLGIHRRSIQKWESGESYPTAENLRALLAFLLTVDVFLPGQEQTEAAALWQQVSEDAPQPLTFFDTAWFQQLLAARTDPATAGGATTAYEQQSVQPDFTWLTFVGHAPSVTSLLRWNRVTLQE